MIQGFADSDTERYVQTGICPSKWQAVERPLARKLVMLDAATSLEVLRSPPGNRLEALKADKAGQFSIRVNDRWRVCFVWTEGGPDKVQVVDYH